MDMNTILVLVQVLFAILVFAIGLPAIILQVSVDDRVARLVHKRLPANGSQVAMIVGLLILLVVVWFPSAGSLCPLTKTLESFAISGGPQRVILSASFVSVIFFWRWLLSQDLRIELARKLEKEIVKGVNLGLGIDKDLLEDFIFLGEFSTSGYRKELVINALDRIRHSVQEEASYSGAELDGMIRTIPNIVINSGEPGNEANFIQCGNLLRKTWRTLKGFEWHDRPDGVACIQSLENLIVSALDSCTESTCRELMEKIHDGEGIFFRVGIESLERHKFRLAVASLSRLEGLFSRFDKAPYELVGLSAHFFDQGSYSLGRGEIALDKIKASHWWNDGAFLNEVVEYFDSIGELRTSHEIREHLFVS